jgi:hypothetical protein
MFLQKYKEKQIFCGHNILTQGVFVTQLPSDAGICLMNCVGYGTLPFHERYKHGQHSPMTEESRSK